MNKRTLWGHGHAPILYLHLPTLSEFGAHVHDLFVLGLGIEPQLARWDLAPYEQHLLVVS